MLVATATPNPDPSFSGSDNVWGFVQGLAVYFLMLFLLICQGTLARHQRRCSSGWLVFANIELLFSLVLFQFFFHGTDFLKSMPYLGPSSTFLSLFFLGLYFLGISVFYVTSRSNASPAQYASQQIRFLVPFSFPFLLFCAFADFTQLLPAIAFLQPESALYPNNLKSGHLGIGQTIVVVAFSVPFLAFVMLILPPIIVRIWQCHPIADGPLRQRLESVCERANFKHGGILTWTVLRDTATAGIVGAFPRSRYIMFTQELLDKLSSDGVEAVLAHEIGHSRHRHLYLYPLIILGAIAAIALFEVSTSPLIQSYLERQHQLEPYGPWERIQPLALFLPEALLLLLYLRLVFGYFSRQFERQADLHVFELGIPPDHMVAALDAVAIHSGYIHDKPSWHHFSIQQRINFLNAAKHNQSLVDQHHARVRRDLLLYVSFVIAACLLVWWLAK